ncbi:hypothetical protein Bcav_0336 [Beutenbergia cavernae DSM 12333]|uniref:Uncharacterized protein n=1 Tax=Beutenbergia cavernae (strain ATCC BAA-8 / DSM 12333 / CCUG 43141 / JCM 11478 / NBRC 16432 / NCIMB 13614 / HKI 0122) TaxID=471853 RepID=C5BWE2_BEUC1|nr:hypothetical protein [Beutenbergia cavernae]ACQ78600.1 hypothetical protein Bcav_0336 [Beutenbergia cavernae DSM 12333]
MSDDVPAPETRSGRPEWWSLAAAIILSAATVASAWSGYEASRWAGESVRWNRSATVARFDATAQLAAADSQRITDVEVFGTWLTAEVAGDDALADAVRERFRPEFVPAFDAWFATTDDGLPPGSPFERDEYVLAAQEQADGFVAEAERNALRADDASGLSTDYVLVAVLYASVLFLAGIASKLRNERVAHLMVALAALVFVGAAIAMLSLPITFGS